MTTASPISDIFEKLFGIDDPRKAGLRRGLSQLTNEQIIQALAVPNVVVDTWNYHEGNFCPLACGVGLHRTMTDPTHEKVLEDLERRGFKVNNTRGIKGNFYTTDRDRDWRLLGHEIILARGKRRLVPVIVGVHMPSKRVLMLQRRNDSKFPNQWCIPGGKIEAGESVAECVHREFTEETGITRKELGLNQRLDFLQEVDSDTNPDLRFSVWLAKFNGPTPPMVQIEDHGFQGYGWFTEHDTKQMSNVMSPAALVVGWLRLNQETPR